MGGTLPIVLAAAPPAFAQDKVVYHIDDYAEQALKGLRNIRNQLDVAPDTKIVVVAHGDGVDFLDAADGVDLQGAADGVRPSVVAQSADRADDAAAEQNRQGCRSQQGRRRGGRENEGHARQGP